MKKILCLLLALFLLSGCAAAPTGTTTPVSTPAPVETVPPTPSPEATAEPAPVLSAAPVGDSELVRVRDYLPDMAVDLRYATADNFTGAVIYDFSEAWLRYGTVKKLAAAQALLREEGYGLLIWDAFRPHSAQLTLWNAYPDPVYVANPTNGGHSAHENGGTVDITLIALDGSATEMPSGFDEFSALADRDYRDVSDAARQNAERLETVLESCGFRGYAGEWWHYSDTDDYAYADIESVALPAQEGSLLTPDCEEYINLRTAPDYSAESLCHILPGETMTPLSYLGDFIRVRYGETEGYVAAAYTKPAD